MRLRFVLVSETSEIFVNQVKLCLFSLRKNAGELNDVPVTLITNGEPLSHDDEAFLKKHFSPITFQVMPRLGAIRHTSKLNAFYGVEPSNYDVLIYLDCDTVIAKPLDRILDPIRKDGAEFVCRRGGQTDRDRFVNFNALVNQFCKPRRGNKIRFEGKDEWPMFNTGVFLATSEAVCRIRNDSIGFTYQLFNEWQRKASIERHPLSRFLLRFKLLRTRQRVLENWTIEQGAVALSCIKSGVKVQYLDEIYNNWGNRDDLRILHCFKSAYRFDRSTMYSDSSKQWIESYSESGLPGKIFLANLIREYKENLGKEE